MSDLKKLVFAFNDSVFDKLFAETPEINAMMTHAANSGDDSLEEAIGIIFKYSEDHAIDASVFPPRIDESKRDFAAELKLAETFSRIAAKTVQDDTLFAMLPDSQVTATNKTALEQQNAKNFAELLARHPKYGS